MAEREDLLLDVLQRFGRARRHDVPALLKVWRARGVAVSLELFLIEEGVLSRFAAAKLKAVERGLLEAGDLGADILTEGSAELSEEPVAVEVAPAAPAAAPSSAEEDEIGPAPRVTPTPPEPEPVALPEPEPVALPEPEPVALPEPEPTAALAPPLPAPTPLPPAPAPLPPTPAPPPARPAPAPPAAEQTPVRRPSGRTRPAAARPTETDSFLRMIRPGERLGRVVLGEPFATGGTSIIYSGEHQTLGIPVVVKVLKPRYCREQGLEFKRFLLEARIGARLNHPSFVRVFDSDVQAGLAYIVMERVDGHSLREYLAAHPLDCDQALSLIDGLARILSLALERGVIHRDVKPHNFFVNQDGTIKLGDFGFARIVGEADLIESEEDLAGVFGSPAYMAPELILGGAALADHRADIYALGVILFEILAGKTPFRGQTSLEILRQHLRDPVPIQILPDETPPAVVRLISTMLAKEPEKRFPGYEALLVGITSAREQGKSTSRILGGLRRLLGGSK